MEVYLRLLRVGKGREGRRGRVKDNERKIGVKKDKKRE